MARKQRSSISVYMPPIPKIEIRNQGNWVKVENGLTHLQPAIQHGYDIGVAKFSDKLIRISERQSIPINPQQVLEFNGLH